MATPAPITDQKSAAAKRILVTGGGGYVGNALCNRIIEEGHSLTVWGRSRPTFLPSDDYLFYPYDLTDAVPATGLEGINAVFHLAHDMDDTEELKINETATKTLRDAVRQQPGTAFIYISSQSARADAPSPYGRIKWQVEKWIDGPGETIVRPGFVYGGAERGSFGTLVRLLNKLPILPVVGYSAALQTVHLYDLCTALVKIACDDSRKKSYQIAAPKPVSFGEFLKKLARHRLRRRVLIIPVPLVLALTGAWLCRLVPGLPNVPKDRILGLTQITFMETADDWDRLNLQPRSLIAGMQDRQTPSRHPLIREGQILLHYISGTKPPGYLVRRYVRALVVQGAATPTALPRLSSFIPASLRFSEPLPGSSSELRRRLDVAVSIVEMSPEGAALFSAYAPSSRVLSFSKLAITLAFEAVLLPLRMFRR